MKKIIVPTDFSDNAWDALMYALRLYDDIPCQFYILNTYEVSGSRLANMRQRARDTRFFKVLKEESLRELKRIDDHLQEYLLNDKHEYITVSKSGGLIDILKVMVAKENIDVIIMGTAGATGAKEIFMGSNTVKAIKQIDDCPIISVPKKFEYVEPENVVFATDFKRKFSEVELSVLRELQLIHDFNVHIVHVDGEELLSDEQRTNLSQLLSIFKNTTVHIVENGKVAKAINDYANENDISLICLMHYEHSFIEKLTHEPIVKKVSFHSQVPLLIMQS